MISSERIRSLTNVLFAASLLLTEGCAKPTIDHSLTRPTQVPGYQTPEGFKVIHEGSQFNQEVLLPAGPLVTDHGSYKVIFKSGVMLGLDHLETPIVTSNVRILGQVVRRPNTLLRLHVAIGQFSSDTADDFARVCVPDTDWRQQHILQFSWVKPLNSLKLKINQLIWDGKTFDQRVLTTAGNC